MYKWHVNSAIGRSRPDIARVADGIAASLRHFSVSLARSDDDAPPRRQRAADTFNEVSSLASKTYKSVGIDARSLAAKPPPQRQPGGFTISRQFVGSADGGERGGYRGGGGGGGGGFRGSSGGFRGGSGGFRGGAGGGFRGGDRGRGGRGGRGRGADRGRGRGRVRMTAKERRKQQEQDSMYKPQPPSKGELIYEQQAESGFSASYEPITTLESLRGYGGLAINSTRGIQENLAHRFAVAAGVERGPEGFRHGREHLFDVSRSGVGMFETKEQKDKALKWQKMDAGAAAEYIENMGVQPIARRNVGSLSEKQKREVLSAWVAGAYVPPVEEVQGKPLTTTGMLMSRNETYLPEDARRFEMKLRSLLPGEKLTAASKEKPRPRRVL